MPARVNFDEIIVFLAVLHDYKKCDLLMASFRFTELNCDEIKEVIIFVRA